MNASKRSLSSLQIRWAVVFDSFPSPAFSHSDSMSRIDSPRTNAPITIARSGSVRNTFVLHGNSLETNGSAAAPDLRDLDPQLPLERLQPARAKAVAKSRVIVAQPALIVGPALIARAVKPGVEFVLNGALDDQPRPELASSDSDSRGLSPTPTASSSSICSSISADGGTVRLTA